MGYRDTPETRRAYFRKYYLDHPEKMIKARLRYVAKQPQYNRAHRSVPEKRIRHLALSAIARAKISGRAADAGIVEFLSEVPPKHCICCGREIDYSVGRGRDRWRSPSIDRVDSERGYTLDNVAIICMRCNFVKGRSSLKELKQLAAYMEAHTFKFCAAAPNGDTIDTAA
jgi:hypothetical protein